MAEWRFGRGWSEAELAQRLAAAAKLSRNFTTPDGPEGADWGRHASRAVIAREPAGPPVPDGPFERGWQLIERYAFSDPRIVRAHFDRAAPLAGRRMLLEVLVLGLHYLGGVVVSDVRNQTSPDRSVRGFRYDTLEGHFERGFEWFQIEKAHGSGDVTFAISATWQRGELPNFWSRIGFQLLARRYQRAWHRLAHLRLRHMLGSQGLPPLPYGRQLVHEGPVLGMPAVQTVASSRPAEIAVEHEAPDRSS
jgi:uncharacterized protein (UPF0548 family)